MTLDQALIVHHFRSEACAAMLITVHDMFRNWIVAGLPPTSPGFYARLAREMEAELTARKRLNFDMTLSGPVYTN